MPGDLALILHAHLPFVRHPEHERFLEESWLYEAITETYLPLLQVLDGWRSDGIRGRITVSMSPTLCAMLQDTLLRGRYEGYLKRLRDLVEREIRRTAWIADEAVLAEFYGTRLRELQEVWSRWGGDLVRAFGELQEAGVIEVITTAVTHAVLPLLASEPAAVRGQLVTARDDYRRCFGREPAGLWLPECGFDPVFEPLLAEAGFRWFVVDAHGLRLATPRPRYGTLAPVYTPSGLAAFGRDPETAQQVWSREAGFPGDRRYRDFYRDIGYDLEFEYVRSALPSPDHRGFTGIKYHRIGVRPDGDKEIYRRPEALEAVSEHAHRFLGGCRDRLQPLSELMGRRPILVAPYDAELFGHWWYEGPEFLDRLMRSWARDPRGLGWVTPTEYLDAHPTQQLAMPAASTWGEGGHCAVWLNETNGWVTAHLLAAQERMASLARDYAGAGAELGRVLNQAARELVLAQASDWSFILRTGTGPEYARERVTLHLARFAELHDRIRRGEAPGEILTSIGGWDPVFPAIDFRSWVS